MYVYVIGSDKMGPVKIGITGQLEKRLQNLRTGHYESLSILYTVEVRDCDVLAVEAYAHRLLSSVRMKGEWFKTSVDKAIEAIQCARHLVKVGIHKVVIPEFRIPHVDTNLPEAPTPPSKKRVLNNPAMVMNVKDMPASIRKRIVKTAHESGMTAGKWLSEVMLEHASQQ